MACFEHSCMNPQCDWFMMDNDSRKRFCPKCGAKVCSFFDEETDHYPKEAYKEENEDV